jgi:manganese/iron transport system substrate-binding protein
MRHREPTWRSGGHRGGRSGIRGGLRVTAVAITGLLVAACGGGGATAAPSGSGEALKVVTTTTILADLVAQVGGENVSVSSLVPKGGEVHTFDPTPSDVRRISDADLVVLNGLGLDDWLADLVNDAGTDAPVVKLAENLEGVTYLDGGHTEEEVEATDEEASGTDADEVVNPHLWLNAAYAAKYAERVAEALAAADPDHAADYETGLAAYAKVLADLDARAKDRLAAIPEANRTVVSFHDAFPYFAEAYGLTIDGTVVDAPGQDPSAGDVSALIKAIKDKGIKAVFAEAQFNEDLVRTIADESGAVVVSDLYTDSVGDAPADTYAGMMEWNIEQVVSALSGS